MASYPLLEGLVLDQTTLLFLMLLAKQVKLRHQPQGSRAVPSSNLTCIRASISLTCFRHGLICMLDMVCFVWRS